MDHQIVITTGSRLHFGFLSNEPVAGRHFGGAGLMIDSPGFRLAARPADHNLVVGPEEWVERGREFVATYRNRCPPAQQPPPCRIDIRSTIPPHAGLGSGTQLGMAIARTLDLLAGDGRADAVMLADRVGRGARSALGVHGFERGGFLVDGGKTTTGHVGALVARADFPSDWRLVLITPTEQGGLSGEIEREAFARLPPMPRETTDRLCRIVLMELLPAVLESDFDACGEALFTFGHTVGDYFAPVQGGNYASARMVRLVAHLRAQGIRGVGQTSWGPTLFVLSPTAEAAAQLVSQLSTDRRWSACRFHIAAPMNTGAQVETLPEAA